MDARPPDSGGDAFRYALYGVTLASDHPFENRLAPAASAPDLRFTCSRDPGGVAYEPDDAVYTSPARIDDGRSFLYLCRRDDHDLMLFSGVAAFEVRDDAIACRLLDDAYRHMVELHLLGFVLAYWLERRGIPALHAAAVAVDGRAVGFLASNKGGKSSLAATLMQLGHPLLSDDILPVERAGDQLLGRPGYPQMRMWPELAEHFVGRIVGGAERLERVHPRLSKRRVPVGEGGLGRFCGEARPLARLYLPARGEAERVEITPLPLAQAVLEIVRNSFLGEILDATGLQAERFALIGELCRRVPVRRVAYPSGLERLPEVRRALLDDLES